MGLWTKVTIFYLGFVIVNVAIQLHLGDKCGSALFPKQCPSGVAASHIDSITFWSFYDSALLILVPILAVWGVYQIIGRIL